MTWAVRTLVLSIVLTCCSIPVSVSAQPQPELGPDATTLVEQWINMSGQFNERLLSTVYWSLGSIGALLVALVGFSWFANYRLYDRDKAALSSEIKGELVKEIANVRRELDKLHDQHVEATTETIRDTVSSHAEPLAKSIERTKADVASVKKMADQLEKNLRMHVQLIEAKHWEQEGIASNVVGCHVLAGHLAFELGKEYIFEDSLEKIEELLRTESARGSFDHELVEFLDSLPNKYGPARERIKRLLTHQQ